jgi:hypothetical protein
MYDDGDPCCGKVSHCTLPMLAGIKFSSHLALPRSASFYLVLPRPTSLYLALPRSTSFYLVPPRSTSLCLVLPRSTSSHLALPRSASFYPCILYLLSPLISYEHATHIEVVSLAPLFTRYTVNCISHVTLRHLCNDAGKTRDPNMAWSHSEAYGSAWENRNLGSIDTYRSCTKGLQKTAYLHLGDYNVKYTKAMKC